MIYVFLNIRLMKTRQKSRLDSRLVEAFNQLKEIQNNINETEKSYKISKKALTEAEQHIHRIEKDLTKSKTAI